MSGRDLARQGPGFLAAALMVVLCAGVAVDVLARWMGWPITGGALFSGWALAWLAMATAASALPAPARGAGLLAWALAGFALQTLFFGLLSAAAQIGGTEPVLGLPVAWRFGGAAAVLGIAIVCALLRGVVPAAAILVGALCAQFAPPAPAILGAAAFGLALVLRVPVALALLAGVALSPGVLNDAALAQTVLRGLGPTVLIAVPLFVLAAAFMVAGGVGEALVSVAAWLSRQRRSASGEANVIASLLFGGVSGSGIADAALGARLIVPAMVRAGYQPPDAAALTAASAILPNLMPPSIALLLAAAATDQSVGRLWVAGIGAGATVAAVLWAVVRFRPPPSLPPPKSLSPLAARVPAARSNAPVRPTLRVLLPPLFVVVAVVGGLRMGLVTATEAGLLAVAVGAGYAVVRRGPGALWSCACEAGLQAGRVALLIGAAAPVSFMLATSGIRWGDLLPAGPAPLVLSAAAALALAAGTVLDVGAAILLLLPLLLPVVTLAGGDPIHATVVIVCALLVGGLTPPVGILVVTVKDITGSNGVFRATLPYLAGLLAAIALLIAVPWLTAGLASL